MTTKIMAEDRVEARNVARELHLLEWQFVDSENSFRGASRAVVVMAPRARNREDFAKLVEFARRRDSHLFEVDAYKRKFMVLALLVRQSDDGSEAYEEREEYVTDEAEAYSLDGTDGWVLVWHGREEEINK